MTRRRWVVMAALGVLFAWALAAWALFLRTEGGPPDSADAVVVLAGESRRLPVGLRLVREGVAPLLVVSRDSSDVILDDEICSGRVAVQHVCFQAVPYSTRGEARAVAELARQRRWGTVAIVTSRFHLRRAGLLMRRCVDAGVRMVAAPDPPTLELARNLVLESVKLADAVALRREC